MAGMRANGYGADLEYVDGVVTIYPGKAMRRMAGTDRVAVPVADIADVEYKPANMVVNGHIKLVLRDPDDTHKLQAYGGRGPVPPDGTEELRAYVKQGIVTTETLVVNWRRKDQAAFAELHQAIVDAVAAI
jgi:hypothetical protein